MLEKSSEQLVHVSNVWLHKEATLLHLLQRKDAQLMMTIQRERLHVTRLRETVRRATKRMEEQQGELRCLPNLPPGQ